MGSSLLGTIPFTEMFAPLQVVILASWPFIAIVFFASYYGKSNVENRIVFFDRTVPIDKRWRKTGVIKKSWTVSSPKIEKVLLKTHIPGRWALTAWTRSVPGPWWPSNAGRWTPTTGAGSSGANCRRPTPWPATTGWPPAGTTALRTAGGRLTTSRRRWRWSTTTNAARETAVGTDVPISVSLPGRHRAAVRRQARNRLRTTWPSSRTSCVHHTWTYTHIAYARYAAQSDSKGGRVGGED